MYFSECNNLTMVIYTKCLNTEANGTNAIPRVMLCISTVWSIAVDENELLAGSDHSHC